LTGITAAVVGVIGNLAVYFTLHTLFNHRNQVITGPLTSKRQSPAHSTSSPSPSPPLRGLSSSGATGPPCALGLCALAGVAVYLIGLAI